MAHPFAILALAVAFTVLGAVSLAAILENNWGLAAAGLFGEFLALVYLRYDMARRP